MFDKDKNTPGTASGMAAARRTPLWVRKTAAQDVFPQKKNRPHS